MNNLKRLSHESFRSVIGRALAKCLLPNKGIALCSYYCSVEVCSALPAKCLLIDDSCGH